MDYLVFSISEDNYAIPVSQVREVLDKKTSLEPRDFHPSFAGFTEFRDGEIPVYDLRKRLDYPEVGDDGEGALIIADTGAADRFRMMAFLVDEVSDVVEVDLRRLSDLPEFEKRGTRSPCRRIIENGDAPIVVLDATSLVEEEEKKALTDLEIEEEIKARPGGGV
jgi:purine-binding chemotaxis protein CheW